MFKVERSYPAPKSLAKKIKYNNEDVKSKLNEIFYKKCYICEQKNITDINVEHLKSHKGNKELKFCWENLFLACSHCNLAKGTKYDEILDYTTDDVEDLMVISYIDNDLSSEILIEPTVAENSKLINTILLLKRCYNGDENFRRFETENLREKIKTEYNNFLKLLLEYSNTNNEKILSELEDELKSSSEFSAIKKSIVNKYPNLLKKLNNVYNK